VDGLLVARGIAAGRVAAGVALLAAPQRVGRGWLGADGDRPGTQVALRALGVRDLYLGALALHVASRPGVGRRTIAASAACDLVDGVATLAARRSLPTGGVAGTVVLALGAAAAGLWASRQLPSG
jgi:hypothetical protein